MWHLDDASVLALAQPDAAGYLHVYCNNLLRFSILSHRLNLDHLAHLTG